MLKITRLLVFGLCISLCLLSATALSAENAQGASPVLSKAIHKGPIWKTIRIGRLELERREIDLNSNIPNRFDPKDMILPPVRSGPKPAISLEFDLHWRAR